MDWSPDGITHHLINLPLALVGSELLYQPPLVLWVIEGLADLMLLLHFRDLQGDIEYILNLHKLYLLCLGVFDPYDILH